RPAGGWNLFAATLEAILADPQHGPTPLSLLDNLRERPGEELYPGMKGSPFELAHRERLRRLALSRETPGSYPTLNRDDMARIHRYFSLEGEELLRLAAALITLSIERTIKERLDDGSGKAASREAARRAHPIAERLYPLILAELRQTPTHGDTAFAHDFRSAKRNLNMDDSTNPSSEDLIYQALEPALDAIDRATLALTMSRQIVHHAERVEHARGGACLQRRPEHPG
ncbi:MAG TPA: hypothetical protein VKQ36_07730, partial [Ktedonobacterales bacterium]|nr:hypothetical protein [Ktedonobacterales bacterium]